MAHKALDNYLNDHLGGATLGSDLAGQIRDRVTGTPFGVAMVDIARQIEEDRQTLVDLMERLETPQNPVKQVTAWMAEKASRVKFGGVTSGTPEFGLFMAIETLSLGVEGKLSLWRALAEVRGDHPRLAETDLDGLIARAQAQHDALEKERIAAGVRALSTK